MNTMDRYDEREIPCAIPLLVWVAFAAHIAGWAVAGWWFL